MLSTLIVLFLAVLVVHVLPQFKIIHFNMDVPEPPQPPEPKLVRLFSGPNDGEVHTIQSQETPGYFIVQYMPMDEDGNPVPDEKNIIQQANGMIFVRPSLAYYQQVTDEDYIYVRDIDEKEFHKMRLTGELPEFRIRDDG